MLEAGKQRRLIRVVTHPATWVVLAALLRLGALFSLPHVGAQLSILGAKRSVAGASGTIEYLQSRVQRQPLTEDEACYDEMARNLVAGRGFVLDSQWLITVPGQPSVYAGCAYPLFVAGVYGLFGAGAQLPVFLLQILLHALAAFLVFQTAACIAGRVAGALAAAYFAFHPMLIWSSLAMMSESLCIPLVAALAWLLVDRRALGGLRRPWLRVVALAAVLAVLALARSTFWMFVPVVAFLLWREARRQRSWVRRLGRPFALLALFATFCSPWAVRNYVHWQRFIPFSTKAGVAAWMHNHPGLHVEFGRRAIFGRQPVDIFSPAIQDLPDEPAREARLMEMFLEFLRENPGKFVGLAAVRLVMSFLPMSVTARSRLATVTAWYAKGAALLALALSLWLARRRLWGRALPLLLFVAYWHGIQSLAGPGLRYRLPSDPVWSILIGVSLAVALVALGRGRSRASLAARWLRAGRRGAVGGEGRAPTA